MKRLPDDIFARRPAGSRQKRRPRLAAIVLVACAVVLLILSRIDQGVPQSARSRAMDVVAPVLERAGVVLSPIRHAARRVMALTGDQQQIARLREENQRLKSWETRALELERRNGELARLVNLVEDPAIGFKTARVFADASGPFAHSVLIGAGAEEGLKVGFPAISADGVVGRVVDVGTKSARLLLLTDLNSRVPVLIGKTGIRGILVGDNASTPRLNHLPLLADIKPGDDVVTSGVGGVFPRGLRVGKVVVEASEMRVAIEARLDALDTVSVLFFETPSIERIEGARPEVGDRRQPRKRRSNERGSSDAPVNLVRSPKP